MTVGRRLKLRFSVTDRLTIGDRQKTADGYLATVGRISRTGIYEYNGSEVGKPEMATVRVYRDAAEVFKEDSIRSFAYKPVTRGHPPVSVVADNWGKYAKGQLGGEALRDGETLAFPMIVMDGSTVEAVDKGEAELSAGYTCALDFTAGTSPAGEEYDAVMTDIIGNHVAIVPKGRAGSQCRMGDAWPVEAKDSKVPPKKEAPKMKIVYDGLTVDLSDEGAATAFAKKLTDAKDAAEKVAADATKALTDAQAAHATALADAQKAHDTEMGQKDAKIADLEGKVLDQSAIDALATAKADIVTQAKTALGDKAPDFAGKSVADVRRATVAVKFGDASVEGKSDDYVEARFDALIAVGDGNVLDSLRQSHLSPTNIVNLGDAKTKALADRAARNAELYGIK